MSDLGSFWARRRAAVKAEEEADLRAAQEAEIAEAQESKSDAEILEDLGLPDPVTLKQGDDFSGFMGAGVPEHLRRVALRTLWRSNPVFGHLDGLNEYDDDYRAAMLLSEPVKTAYQVGKGMKTHLEELKRKAESIEDALDGSDVDERALPEGDGPQVKQQDAPVASAEDTTKVAVTETVASSNDGIEELTIPRRMRFRFEEASA